MLPWSWATCSRAQGGGRGGTDLFQLLKVLPEELHGAVRLGDTEVNNAVFEHLLDAVFLDIQLTSLQAVLLF